MKTVSFPSYLFEVEKPQKLCIVDASTLGETFIPSANIAIVSDKGTTEWTIVQADRCPDGSLAGWKFHPTLKTLKDFPVMRDWVLLVVNS